MLLVYLNVILYLLLYLTVVAPLHNPFLELFIKDILLIMLKKIVYPRLVYWMISIKIRDLFLNLRYLKYLGLC